jgi:hypothetical protein
VRGHLAGGQALGDQRDDQVLHAPKAPLALADDRGLEAGIAVTGHLEFDWADLGQDRLGAMPVAGVAAIPARRVVLGIAQVGVHLALQRALQHQPGHALQQPVRAGQADPLRAGLLHQLCDQLLVDRIRLCSRQVLGLLVLGRDVRHVASPPVCHRHSLSRSYTVVFTVPKFSDHRIKDRCAILDV